MIRPLTAWGACDVAGRGAARLLARALVLLGLRRLDEHWSSGSFALQALLAPARTRVLVVAVLKRRGSLSEQPGLLLAPRLWEESAFLGNITSNTGSQTHSRPLSVAA